MQKLINAVALFAGLTSVALIGGSSYLLLQKDAIIEGVKKQTVSELEEVLPGLITELMPKPPELPKVTGGALPLP